ncbi:hypothetical protein OAD40_01030 [bacterium]|nr:hypothetical protein [bacterium]
MKSLDDEKERLEALVSELHLNLGATLALMDSYQLRDEGYFVKLAADTNTKTKDNAPDELAEYNRRMVLRQLIQCFRPMKNLLQQLDQNMPTETLERLVDELWEIERGGRNWLLKRPKGAGRGNRPSIATSIRRTLLAVAYDKYIEAGESKDDAISIISDESGLPYSTVRDSIKDIKEAAKDDDTTKLYRTLGAQAREANEFLKAYKAIMPS